MRPFACAFLVAASLASGSAAWAAWVEVSLLELARESDAIVVGRLTDARAIAVLPGPGSPADTLSPPGTMPAPNAITVFRGTIRVDSTLWARLPTRKSVTVEWSVWEGSAETTDLRDLAGLDVLWLLEKDPKARNEVVYRADLPKRAIRLGSADDVDAARAELARVTEPGPRVRSMKGVLTTAAAKR